MEAEIERQKAMLQTIAEQDTARLHQGQIAWTTWLERAAAYGSYGFANTLLIAAQRPDATAVRSYEGWQALGRQVTKGEHSIRILSQTGRPRSVFDIAQTSGTTPPQQPTLTPAQAYDRLRALLLDHGVRVNRAATYWFRPAGSEHVIAVDAALDDPEAAAYLAHQLAHVLLHHKRTDGAERCAGTRRCEADSIGWIVLTRLGIRPPKYTDAPVTNWAGTDLRAKPYATIHAVGGRILRAAARIDRELGQQPTEFPQPVDSELPALQDAEPAQVDPVTSPSNRHTDIHRDAHAFFQEHPGWTSAYLRSRGFDSEVVGRWGIGYAPQAWDALTKHLSGLGYSDEELIVSGVVRKSRSGRLYDAFRDRLMLPLRRPDGTIAGFIGRRRDECEGPKYLNSPDSPHFHKGEILFGLPEVHDRLDQDVQLVLVEGPFDAIAINTALPDSHAAVATCGTAITAEHVRTLGAAAEGLVLALDGDRAGRDAALRAWPLLSTLAASVAILPDGQDPATLFQRHGTDALRQALLPSKPLVDVVIDDRIRRAGGPLTFLQQRLDAATAAATVLAVLPADQISERVAALAQRLDLAPELITSALLNAVSPAADDFPFGPLHGSTAASTTAESRTPSNQTRHRRTR